MKIHRAQDTRTTDTPNGNHITPLAAPSLGATEVTVIRQRQVPGGFNPLHAQTREEIMVQLAGRVTVSSGEQHTELAPGDTLIIPAGAAHRVENTGETEAEWLIVSAAGMQFVRDAGEAMTPSWAQ